MITYRALMGTIVSNNSISIKFQEVLYSTDKKEEQELLEATDGVSVYGEVSQEIEKTETETPKKKGRPSK